MPKKSRKLKPKGVTLPISYEVPDDIETLHATNFTVGHAKDEFALNIFEIVPPIILDSDDAVRWLNENDIIKAQCLARIAITPKRMRELMNMLTKEWDKFQLDEE